MSRREIIGFAVVACVACCVGPIVGILGAIAALGVASTVLIGAAGLAVEAAAVAALVIVRRRRTDTCRNDPSTVAVALGRQTP